MEHQTCCCCIGIKSGVITLGVLSMLGGITDIIFGSTVISNNNNDCYYNTCYDEDNWYGTTSIIQGSIGCIVSIVLILGVVQRKPNLLMPYVAMMIVNEIAYMTVAIILLINVDYYNGAYFGIWLLIWSCILCYFIYVVRLYRLIMIQQILAASGLISAYPAGTVLNSGVVVNPYPAVATVYPTQTAYNSQLVYSSTAYPPPGSYPQPGYPQPGYPQTGYPQPGYPQTGYPQPGSYQQQGSYPPPYTPNPTSK